MNSVTETKEYIAEAFQDIAEIVEKSVGAVGLVSKKLILNDLKVLTEKWTACQIAYREQKQELEALRKQNTDLEQSHKLLSGQLTELTKEVRGNK